MLGERVNYVKSVDKLDIKIKSKRVYFLKRLCCKELRFAFVGEINIFRPLCLRG